MTKCPDCGREVSTDAASCPQCGKPLKTAKPQVVVTTEKTRPIAWTCLFAILGVVGLIVILVILSYIFGH